MGKRLPTTPRSRIKNAIRQVWLRSRERAAALKSTGHRCARCGVKASQAKGREVKLQVHHADGIDWEGVVDLVISRVLASRMVPLCVECHADEHKGGCGAENAQSGVLERSRAIRAAAAPRHSA